MSKRLTKEREQEIREWTEHAKKIGKPCEIHEALLFEIDAIRVETSQMVLNANDYAIRLMKERDELLAHLKLKDEMD